MAIVNIQAVTGSDDIERIIEVLEKNGWDETKAANEMMEVHPEVRAPISYQQEQLIDLDPV